VLLLAAIAATIALTRGGAAAQVVAVLPNSVVVIDPRTNGVLADTPVGNTPTTVVAWAESIWVLNSNEQTVSRIDPRTRAVVRLIPATMSASDIAAGAGALWVAGRKQTLAKIDPKAPLNASTLALSDPQSAISAGSVGRVAAAGRAVWATSPSGIWRIEPTPRRQFAIAGGSCCGPIAIGLGSIWAAHEFSLERLNASSGASEAHIALPFAGSSMAIGTDGVWVGDQLTDRVWFVDPKKNALDVSIQVGQHPSAIAIGAGAVWVASADGTVARIDRNRHRVTKTIVIGGTPSGIAVGAGLIWVAVD
jgi:DNA-binding beta-propeller fold protein YncE